jgi:hypothetical protein
MTRDDIIRMAREAGLMVETSDGWDVWQPDNLESFVALVEQERGRKYPIALTHEQYNIVVEAAIADGAAAEREECAKVCEEWLHGEWHNQGVIGAMMIRARSK